MELKQYIRQFDVSMNYLELIKFSQSLNNFSAYESCFGLTELASSRLKQVQIAPVAQFSEYVVLRVSFERLIVLYDRLAVDQSQVDNLVFDLLNAAFRKLIPVYGLASEWLMDH